MSGSTIKSKSSKVSWKTNANLLAKPSSKAFRERNNNETEDKHSCRVGAALLTFLTKTYHCKRLSTLENNFIFIYYFYIVPEKKGRSSKYEITQKNKHKSFRWIANVCLWRCIAYIPQIMNNLAETKETSFNHSLPH